MDSDSTTSTDDDPLMRKQDRLPKRGTPKTEARCGHCDRVFASQHGLKLHLSRSKCTKATIAPDGISSAIEAPEDTDTDDDSIAEVYNAKKRANIARRKTASGSKIPPMATQHSVEGSEILQAAEELMEHMTADDCDTSLPPEAELLTMEAHSGMHPNLLYAIAVARRSQTLAAATQPTETPENQAKIDEGLDVLRAKGKKGKGGTPCPFCNAMQSSMPAYKYHVLKRVCRGGVSASSQYICPLCAHGFTSPNGLQFHLRSQTCVKRITGVKRRRSEPTRVRVERQAPAASNAIDKEAILARDFQMFYDLISEQLGCSVASEPTAIPPCITMPPRAKTALVCNTSGAISVSPSVDADAAVVVETSNALLVKELRDLLQAGLQPVEADNGVHIDIKAPTRALDMSSPYKNADGCDFSMIAYSAPDSAVHTVGELLTGEARLHVLRLQHGSVPHISHVSSFNVNCGGVVSVHWMPAITGTNQHALLCVLSYDGFLRLFGVTSVSSDDVRLLPVAVCDLRRILPTCCSLHVGNTAMLLVGGSHGEVALIDLHVCVTTADRSPASPLNKVKASEMPQQCIGLHELPHASLGLSVLVLQPTQVLESFSCKLQVSCVGYTTCIVCFGENDRFIAAGHKDGLLQLWDRTRPSCVIFEDAYYTGGICNMHVNVAADGVHRLVLLTDEGHGVQLNLRNLEPFVYFRVSQTFPYVPVTASHLIADIDTPMLLCGFEDGGLFMLSTNIGKRKFNIQPKSKPSSDSYPISVDESDFRCGGLMIEPPHMVDDAALASGAVPLGIRSINAVTALVWRAIPDSSRGYVCYVNSMGWLSVRNVDLAYERVAPLLAASNDVVVAETKRYRSGKKGATPLKNAAATPSKSYASVEDARKIFRQGPRAPGPFASAATRPSKARQRRRKGSDDEDEEEEADTGETSLEDAFSGDSEES